MRSVGFLVHGLLLLKLSPLFNILCAQSTSNFSVIFPIELFICILFFVKRAVVFNLLGVFNAYGWFQPCVEHSSLANGGKWRSLGPTTSTAARVWFNGLFLIFTFAASYETHTQRIETTWRPAKQWFRNRHVPSDHFCDYLCDYMWRQKIWKEKIYPFETLLQAIYGQYCDIRAKGAR